MITDVLKRADKWDARFIELAFHISQWSKDPSTKVGAVIVDQYRRVVSLGYNGFPRDINDSEERLYNKDIKLQIVKHAEENAILNCGRDSSGCTIYVSHCPCASCAGTIIQSGIRRVVYCTDSVGSTFTDRWRESIQLAGEMLREAQIEVKEFVRHDYND